MIKIVKSRRRTTTEKVATERLPLVSQFLNNLRVHGKVEVRDAYGCELFTCPTNSPLLSQFSSWYVFQWFPGAPPFKRCDFVMYIKENGGE